MKYFATLASGTTVEISEADYKKIAKMFEKRVESNVILTDLSILRTTAIERMYTEGATAAEKPFDPADPASFNKVAKVKVK